VPLAPRAVKDFLARERRDWRWYKRLTDAKLDARMGNLPVRPPIWNRLRRHQKIGLLLGIRLKRLCYWFDTGTGKTMMSIALMRYFKKKGTMKRALVLVPTLVVKSEWVREIKKHTRELSYLIPSGDSECKYDEMLKYKPDVTIETYRGLMRMVSSLERTKKSARERYRPDRKKVKAVTSLFDTIILDESGEVGNHMSLNYRICRKLTQKAAHVFTLNATPFNRDPTPMWAQMKLVDNGHTLGEHVGLFRAAFFNEVENGWGGTEHHFKENKSKLLNKLIANRSLQYTADESDLPKLVEIRKHFNLHGNAQMYYGKALTSLRKSRGDVKELKNEFLRMRQLSSGFLGYKDDKNSKSAQLEFQPNEKLELLIGLVRSIVDSYKVVVFNEFTFSGSMICRELTRLGIKHCRVWGGTKDPDEELRRFSEDDDYRVMVLNNAAGGRGLNLQVARYGIYYERPVSAVMFKQTRARVVRQGSQHHNVIVYDLIMRGGVDEKIIEFHEHGEDLLQAILKDSATM
jgi:SNF2 family DNA or RNA helicase